jgi:hypothetical protein
MQIEIKGGSAADLRERIEAILSRENGILDPDDAGSLAGVIVKQLGVRGELQNEFPFRVKTVDILIHNTAEAEDSILDLLSGLRDDNPDVVVEWAASDLSREIGGPAAVKRFESDVEYPDKGDPRLDPLVPRHERVKCVLRTAFGQNHTDVKSLVGEILETIWTDLPDDVVFLAEDGTYYAARAEVVVKRLPYADAVEAVKKWNADFEPSLPAPRSQWQ